MGISIRDERGQGVVEYILLLVVLVSIILGGVYQLNSAFKTWANNYFGNYLTCLLETGELPTLSGSPGDSGLCNQLFEPFDLAKGRRLAANANGNANGENAGNGTPDAGSTENTASTPIAGTGGTTGQWRPSNASSGGGGSSVGNTRRFKPGASTGNTSASDYGSFNGSNARVTRIGLKSRLDTTFALKDEREDQQRGRTVASKKSEEGSRPKKTAIRLKGKSLLRDGQAPDSGLTVSGFMRFLIIAAIILALVIFLGGQVLQINKQMDG